MKSCGEYLTEIRNKIRKTRELIVYEYQKDNTPWYIGYSGGKDSSALLVLVYNALKKIKIYHKPVSIIYCDTGVEIPPISDYVHKTLINFKKELEIQKLPFNIKIAEPELNDRYFVKVIGRGYPPPTNIFRWYTDRLRINPVKSIIDSQNQSVVLLGIRNGESIERDRIINKHRTDKEYYLNQNSSSNTKIFSPIINYTLKDIWNTLMYNKLPNSIDCIQIADLYKDAGSECPVYKETKGTPCGKGRFGCWTCTVVRKDKSVASMIKNGYKELKPLFYFRNWLIEFRDNLDYRCNFRRNGQKGLGPITLKGREIILSNLMKIQEESKLKLIFENELERIKTLWEQDCHNPKYIENLVKIK